MLHKHLNFSSLFIALSPVLIVHLDVHMPSMCLDQPKHKAFTASILKIR